MGTWDVGRGTWDVGRVTWDVGRGTWAHAYVFVREPVLARCVGALLPAKCLDNIAKLCLTIITFSDRRPFRGVCRLSTRCNHILLRGSHLQHCELQSPHNVACIHRQLDVYLDHAQHNLAGNLCHSSLYHRQTGRTPAR